MSENAVITPRDLHGFDMDRHDDFWLCRFAFTGWLPGPAHGAYFFDLAMYAVVFDQPGRVAVHCLNFKQHCRSKDFEPALRAAINFFA